MNCYLHPENPAVAECTECGKGICKNCYDESGGNVCSHCVEKAAMAAAMARLSEAEDFKAAAVKARKGMMIGGVIGGVIGLFLGISSTTSVRGGSIGESLVLILLAFIIMPVWGFALGGSFVTVVKAVIRMVIKVFSFLNIEGAGFFIFLVTLGAIGPVLGGLSIVAPIVTGVRFFMQKKAMEKGDAMIEECKRALAQLQGA